MTKIKAQLVLFICRNQKNGGLAEYFGSIWYPRERVQTFQILLFTLIKRKYQLIRHLLW